MKAICIYDENCAFIEKGKLYDVILKPMGVMYGKWRNTDGYRLSESNKPYVYPLCYFELIAPIVLNPNIKIL
jgi:hypothetical protein